MARHASVRRGARVSHPLSTPVARQTADITRYACADYLREACVAPSGARAQIVTIPAARPNMIVAAHSDLIDFDFRKRAVRSDAHGDFQERLGFLLSDELRTFCDSGTRAVLLNGNNVGYWGNQFVIENGRLQYKKRGPLFDDGEQIRAHATGHHAFFFGRNGFHITNLSLVARPAKPDDTATELDVEPGRPLPRFGVSGFPLIKDRVEVWRDHAPLAWDPGLLFDQLGPISGRGYDYGSLRGLIQDLLQEDAPLARHPMTILGLNRRRDIVLFVVEAPGTTVAEAATMLRRRYGIEDAIVLGAAGDAQLATTHEGFLVDPVVADYAEHSARSIPPRLVHPALRGQRPLRARPVPSYIAFHLGGPLPASHAARHALENDGAEL